MSSPGRIDETPDLKSALGGADGSGMKTRLYTTLVLALAVALVGPLSSAGAATRPTVKSVSPLQTKVGQTLKINGTGFLSGANRNTVIFMSNYGPTVFVKAARSSTRTMYVTLPARLEAGMPRSSTGALSPARFRLRVVSRDPARWFTARSMSPVISPRSLLAPPPPPPPDIDKDGIPDSSDPDNDNDFLDDSVEKAHGTNTRVKDTDGDGLEDGWEYHSAKDLNVKAVPYPGQRPFPNALDPSDVNVDFDGDFLRSGEEHALWKYTGRGFDKTRLDNGVEDSPLGYSDGTQTSRREQAPARPAFQRFAGRADLDPDYDPQWREPTYPDFLARRGDPEVWSDDERDADRDGLNNMTEEHGTMSKRVWDAWLNGAVCGRDGVPAVKPWKEPDGAYYGAFTERPFAEPTMTDPDVDGDGLLDAEDDQDNDDVPNYSEMDFECKDGLMHDPDGDGPGEPEPNPSGTPNVNPYNPCAPYGGWWTPFSGFPMARTCPRDKPLGA